MLGEEQSIDISRGVSVKLMHNGSKNMNVNGIQFKIKDNLTAITAFNVTVQGQEV